MKSKIPTTLLIKSFPPELAELCLSSSGESVLTRAVLSILYKYFELELENRKLVLENKDLHSDIDLFKSFLNLETQVNSRRSEVLKILSDPNRFYLHVD